jgi:Tfp pilus assembly protein PilF
MQRQENTVALKHYEHLTRMRRVAGDHYLLGIGLINAGKTQESIAALMQSLRIDPLLELAHEQLAVLFEHHNDHARADSHRKTLREIRSYRRSYPLSTTH